MGSSKKDKKPKEKKKHKRRSQDRSRSRSRDRRHKRDRKRDADHNGAEPESKRRREHADNGDDYKSKSHRSRADRASPGANVKKENEESEIVASKSSGGEISLSVEETNKLRAKLGLKPLDAPSSKSDAEKASNNEDVHKPAVNIGTMRKQDALREKLLAAKEKRRVNKILGKVKTLGDSDSEDDAQAWVEKSRRRQLENEQAEKTAKMLAQMDEEFGISDLVEQEFGTKKSYDSKDLTGLKVEHAQDRFAEGKTVILTLKDKGVLDEEDNDDTLVNVNMIDDERATTNVENKKKKPDYKPYDEPEFDEHGMLKSRDILEKYDEEIHGKQKETFALGAGGKYDPVHERRMQEMRTEIQQQGQTLTLPAPQIAAEFFTPEEMSFKKVKKKVRKIRKKNKVVTADDLLPLADDTAAGSDLGSRRGRRRHEEGELVDDAEVKKEAVIPGLDLIPAKPIELITDDTEAPTEDLSGIKVEEEGAALELELAIKKTRKINNRINRVNILKDIAEKVKVKEEPESGSDSEQAPVITPQRRRGGNIVLDGTSEFCRSLGDIPTYGQAGNRVDEDEDELLDFERQLKEERRRMEEMEADPNAPGWQEVEVMQAEPVDLVEQEERGIMDEEPVLNAGVGAALDLAVKKGYLGKEKDKTIKKGKKNRIEADNYSIEDKRYDDLDEKYNRKGRDRYGGGGMVQDFTEKRDYKPDVKLEYFDEKGHSMNHKEAFRYLSHRFHGKGSGKAKTEKRHKKLDQESLMNAMTSTDTPLNTASMLEGKLKKEKTPYLVLSGANKMGPSSLSKT